MKLINALDQIQEIQDNNNDVIFAKKPWTLDSEADIKPLDIELRVPKEIIDIGLTYFLEINVAKEVLEVFNERVPTNEERYALLIYYAENDAYPDWVYNP
jgi:hypothetical protein